MRLVMGHPDWALGFEDETWWSRFEQPRYSTWCEAAQLPRLIEQVRRPQDKERKALACYGLLVRWRRGAEPMAEKPMAEKPMAEKPMAEKPMAEKMLLRFVDGRPVSAITLQFLEWCCVRLQAMGKRVLAMVWDNASWHSSQTVKTWIRAHNRQVKRSGQGVRILVCPLPVKSPWLNPIEPKWMHGKRRVAEPDRTLTIQELADRICATFECTHEEHLSIPDYVA
jgi:hypothetical protein